MPLKSEFPDGRFSAPGTVEEIARVERELGITLPDQLRALYLESDGFREPLGNAKYLLSLLEEDTIESLLSMTRFYWKEWPEILSTSPDFSRFVFFGMSSTDEVWGMRLDAPFEIIRYHHSMIAEYEIAGRDILDIYKADLAQYDLT